MRYVLVLLGMMAGIVPVVAGEEAATAPSGVSMDAVTEPSTAPASTEPASTEPATTTSQPAVDRTSPEKTWAAICSALESGDTKGFQSGFYNRNELSKMFLDAYSDATVSSFDLGVAASTLGNEGKEFSKTLETVYTDLVKMGEDHTTEATPELVRWVREQKTAKGNVQEVIYFKLFRGEWLVDTVRTYSLDSDSGREGAEKLIDSLPKVTAEIKKITAEIREGTITTVEQMRSRMAKTK